MHTPERRAAHEAAHVVVAIETGWAFEFATLRQHPQFSNLWGYVQYNRPLERRTDLDRWVPTFLAGQFGEIQLLGFAGPGGSQDSAIVMEQIRAHIGTGPDAMQFFQRAYQQAQEIVERRVEAVRTVSVALLERETLTQAEVIELL